MWRVCGVSMLYGGVSLIFVCVLGVAGVWQMRGVVVYLWCG